MHDGIPGFWDYVKWYFGKILAFFTRPGLLVLEMVCFGAGLACAASWGFVEVCRVVDSEGKVSWNPGLCEVIVRSPPWLLLSGLATVPALLLTWYWREKHKREDINIANEGQVTERFTRAIAQLGHGEAAIRIGGIYALERIMKDSPRDHWTIVETLSAFIRLKSPIVKDSARDSIDTDVQAALTVIGRRKVTNDGANNAPDLSACALSGADLTRANLSGANLSGADLTEAILHGANLTEAILHGAKLTGAKLSVANLARADLYGADLSGAMGLTEQSLSRAILDEATVLPEGIERPKRGGTEAVNAEKAEEPKPNKPTEEKPTARGKKPKSRK